MSIIPYSKEELCILTERYGKIYTRDLIPLLNNRSYDSITKKAAKMGLKSPIKSRITIFYDQNYFKIPNISNSYWAGLLAADGYVDKKRNIVGIDLCTKDIELLEKFKESLNYSGTIKTYIRTKNGYNGYDTRSRLYFSHANKMINDLNINFSLEERKSLTLLPPQIKNMNCIKSFIIGFIDGDGCISLNKKQNKLYLKIAVTEELGKWFNKIFSKLYGIKHKKITRKGKIYYYALSDRTALKVFKNLDKIKVPKLRRKWDNIYKYENNICLV